MMDPEIKDKSNNCETADTSVDSSPLNNNNVLKDGVKKVSANSMNAEDCAMDVDTEENLSPSAKYTEKKNGIHDANSKKESQKTDVQNSNDTDSSNHEQNNVDESDLTSDTVSNKESINIQQSEQNQTDKCKENEQNTDKNNEPSSNTSEHLEDPKSKSDSNGQLVDTEAPMDIDASLDKDSPKSESSSIVASEKVDCANENVRPEKASVSSEQIASEKSVTVNSSKAESSDNDTKDVSNIENEAAISIDKEYKSYSSSEIFL